MSAEFVALHEQGHTYSAIAAMHGTSRCAVAGAIYRARNPKAAGIPRRFRDEQFARECVALADAVGLMKAAKLLGMDGGQLCRWRQRLRAMATGQ